VCSIDVAPTLLRLIGVSPPGSMGGLSLADCLHEVKGCPGLGVFNETGGRVTNIPGLPETHLCRPDLFELFEIADRASGT